MTDIANDQLREHSQIPLLQDSNGYEYAFDSNGKAVVILEWSIVAIIVMLLVGLIRKRSRTNEMNLSRHPDAIQIEKQRQEEEAKRKITIIKLFQTEHIQQVRIEIPIDFALQKPQNPIITRLTKTLSF